MILSVHTWTKALPVKELLLMLFQEIHIGKAETLRKPAFKLKIQEIKKYKNIH